METLTNELQGFSGSADELREVINNLVTEHNHLLKGGRPPRWTPDSDATQLDIPALFSYAIGFRKSVGRLLAEAGWPVVKLKPYNWDGPVQFEGQLYPDLSYIVQKSALLDGEDDQADGWQDLMRLDASTDAQDMEGDLITLPALKKIKQASIGQTLFLNHSYKVPKDVAGIVEKSRLLKKQIFHPLLQKTGTFNVVELGVRPIPKEQNKAGWRACEMVMKGTAKLGASVTALATDMDTSRKHVRVINDVLQMETSLVGLPANMTAWGQPNKVRKSMVAVPALPIEEAPLAATPLQSITNSAPSALLTKNAADARPEEPPIMNDPVNTTELPAQSAQPVVEQQPTVTTETAIVQKATPLADLVTLRKGYFAETYAERTANIYFLTSLLCDALQNLDWKVRYPSVSDKLSVEDAIAAMLEACDEFKAKVAEKLSAKWTNTTDKISKSAEALLGDENARLEASDFLTPSAVVPMAQIVLSKAGKRNSTSDASLIQDMHDITVKLDAKCAMPKSAEAALSNGASLPDVANVETLQKAHADEKVRLTKALDAALALAEQATSELEEARRETARWKANSEVSLAALEEFGLQPLEAGA